MKKDKKAPENVWLDENADGKPFGVTYHNEQGEIISADKAAQELLGFSQDELMGRGFFESVWQPINKDGQKINLDDSPVKMAVKSGKIVSDVIVGITHPISQSLRWLMLTAIPVFKSNETSPQQVFCQIYDLQTILSNNNHIEKQLNLLQEFWQTLTVHELTVQSVNEVLQKITEFLPNIFSFPEITQARLMVNGQSFTTKNFKETNHCEVVQIHPNHTCTGQIEYHYQQEQMLGLANLAISADKVMLDTLAKDFSLYCQIIEQKSQIEALKVEASTAYDQTIEAWSAALEVQDKEASGHTRRVTDLALELAKEMGFKDKELVNIRRGALLHDIGKMSIPDEILLKPGKLTEDEFNIVKKHPEFTRKWLSQIELLKPALQIPYYHHERWDGSGYPQGLTGEDIPLVARMFAVIDVWDALISDRPFRHAMSIEEALDLIVSESGNQFDPDVVESFLKVLSRKDYFDTSHEIKVQAFGQASVWVQDRRISSKDWQVHSAKDLFFLILANPGGLTKEQVGLHMWPDISSEDLSVRFKNTLYRLRHAVGNQVILLSDYGYQFNKMMDYQYDVENFTTRIQKAQTETDQDKKIIHLSKAVAQYQGDYLPEVDEFWVITDREKYRLMYVRALVQLSELYYQQNDYLTSLRYSSQALEEDPVEEAAHRMAMRVYAAEGKMANVVRQYEACCAALLERFGIEPSEQTRELYETLVES